MTMKKNMCLFLCVIVLFSLSTIIHAQTVKGVKDAGKKTFPVLLKKISDKFYVHITFKQFGRYKIDSNGLIAVTDKGLVLIDTPWDNNQTERLLAKAEKQLGKKVVLAIITHAHQDRIGGIDTLIKKKIKVISTPKVCDFAKKAGYASPTPSCDPTPYTIKIGSTKIEVFYPGEAHTADNITVYFPAEKLLAAGCLAKTVKQNNLGNTTEANLKEWPNTIKNLLTRYPKVKTVLPGHGKWGNIAILHHTLKLLQDHNSK